MSLQGEEKIIAEGAIRRTPLMAGDGSGVHIPTTSRMRRLLIGLEQEVIVTHRLWRRIDK